MSQKLIGIFIVNTIGKIVLVIVVIVVMIIIIMIIMH